MEKSTIRLPLFSVSDFVAALNQSLEYAYPQVGIEGEVAEFKVNQGKFVFFTLKDASASVGCFMTVWQLRMPIEDGMKVVVTGIPKVTAWGKFSITVQAIRPSGQGNLKRSFELLKAKLAEEGLFVTDRKRILPRIPHSVGVISSTQAAGYADFMKLVNDRWGGIKINVAHVQVQGEGAADQIMRAIDYFNGSSMPPEVLVIIRGGGSADDLSVFNDELLVRAVAGSRIPTLTGIGHETDESLVDLVADVRAVTPSNAAQLLVPDRREIITELRHKQVSMISRVQAAMTTIQTETNRAMSDMYTLLVRRCDMLLAETTQARRLLVAFDPQTVLQKGYAMIRGHLAVGAAVEIETQYKLITAEVTYVKDK